MSYKSVLFTHNDLDGAGCRIMFELAHTHLTKGEEYDVINCSNNNVDQKVNEMLHESGKVDSNTWVCFADICPSREVLEVIAKEFSHIDIWDHHRSNFFATWIIPNAKIVPESPLRNECGTSIMYQWFSALAFSDEKDPRGYFFRGNGNAMLLQDFVENVRLRDTWDWKITNDVRPKMLNSLFFLLGMDRFCNRYIDRIKDNESSSDLIMATDQEFVDAKMEYAQRAIDGTTIDNLIKIKWNGYNVGLSYGVFGANVSDLADSLLERYPEVDIFVNCSLAGSGSFEFRCKKKDIDISQFAVDLGGGGHADASGAPIPQHVKDMITDIVAAHLNGESFITTNNISDNVMEVNNG